MGERLTPPKSGMGAGAARRRAQPRRAVGSLTGADLAVAAAIRAGAGRGQRGEFMKVGLDKIYEDLNFTSDRLSTQIRTLTLGVLALVWLFLSGNENVAKLNLTAGNRSLLTIAGLCVVTLLLDAIQYWAFYFSANAVRKRAEKQKSAEASYDEKSGFRRLQRLSFWAKQFTALAATVWLLAILLRTIWK